MVPIGKPQDGEDLSRLSAGVEQRRSVKKIIGSGQIAQDQILHVR